MNYPNPSQKNFCFCTLALGSRYRMMAQDLAKDLEKYSPGTCFVVGTDSPRDFQDFQNVLAFMHHQTGILHCFNDKRFLFEKSLEKFKTAIYVDADTRIVGDIPNSLEYSPGITGCYRNLVAHVSQYRPQDLGLLQNLAIKLDIPLEKVDWIGESLLIVSRDGGKEQEFIKFWGLMASYLELKGMHSGEGSIIGLAATKIGWTVSRSQSWETLNQLRQHLDASDHKKPANFWNQLKQRISYHYRFNKSRLLALKNFDFYYR